MKQTTRHLASVLTVGVLLAPIATLRAGEVTLPNTFTANTPAVAGEVNANFTAVASGVNDNDARIAVLEATVASLQAALTTAQNNVTTLQALLTGVTREKVNGQPTVRFTGVNVQVVNGSGNTATANGTGNLIVGYDEMDGSGASRCTLGTASDGTQLNASNCEAKGGTLTTAGFKTGSHYLIVGSENNYSRWGGVLVGFRNTSNFDYASVSGGAFNTASGKYASVSGGNGNTASGDRASVSGGVNNKATGSSASVSGGALNKASVVQASVSGGYNNTASEVSASVSGGSSNTASGPEASVSGGYNNTASGFRASVSGGNTRNAVTDYDWAAGSLFQDF